MKVNGLGLEHIFIFKTTIKQLRVMDNSVDEWMKQWVDLVYKEIPLEDFWIKTPIGSFKNPKIIPTESESDNEIHLTIKYDEWNKNYMNKEQQELFDEAYDCYTQTNIVKDNDGTETHISPAGHYNRMTKEEFINKCKIDSEFSEECGLKIEERDLSLEERQKICNKKFFYQDICWHNMADIDIIEYLKSNNIPTKLSAITYNGKTIENYE